MVYCGLASKAGKVICGAVAVQEEILKRKVFIVIIAEDSSVKTKEKFLKLSSNNNVKAFVTGNIDDNSNAIGKKNKAIIAVLDRNFSEAISRIIDGGDTIGQN